MIRDQLECLDLGNVTMATLFSGWNFVLVYFWAILMPRHKPVLLPTKACVYGVHQPLVVARI